MRARLGRRRRAAADGGVFPPARDGEGQGGARRARPRRPRDQARALFRNAILDAAEAVFAERGFRGARIQDIAARARIGVGTLYNHFEQKDGVLRALLEERLAGMLAELASRPGDPADFERRLTARIGRLLGFIESHRAFYAILTGCGGVAGDVRPGVWGIAGKPVSHIVRVRDVFRALAQEGLDEGTLDPSFGAAQLAVFLSGAIRGTIVHALLNDGEGLAERAPAIVRLFLGGAARRRP